MLCREKCAGYYSHTNNLQRIVCINSTQDFTSKIIISITNMIIDGIIKIIKQRTEMSI